jgi:hypothetical protein
MVVSGQSKETVFSVTAQKDSRLIAIDVSQSDTEVEVEPVLELFVKALEANPTLSIFGAIPVLSKRARDVATMNSILVAEAPNPSELAKKILEIAGHG